MAASSTRYRPGSWTAVVRPGVWLLAHSVPEDSVVERIWLALEQPEVETEALLAELVKANEGVADGGFAFVRSGAQATDVVVGGQGIVELVDAQGGLQVFMHAEGTGSATSALVEGCAAIRLRSAAVARAEFSLPVVAAVVLASAIEYSAASLGSPAPEPAAPEPVAQEPVVQEPVVQEPGREQSAEQQGSAPRGEDGFLDASVEPARVLAAGDLDWMAPGAEQPPAPQAEAGSETASGDWLEAHEEPVYAPPRPQDQYAASWGAPGQPFPVYDEAMARIPPPPGLLPAAEQTFANPHPDQPPGAPLPMPQGPPILPGPPGVPGVPGPPVAQPGFAVTEPPPQPGFGVSDQPLVAAVYCPYGHITPAGSPQCRRCRTAVAPQEPFTVTRPCLGRLRLSNGEVYPLDRDVVFGRRPEVPVGRPGPQPNAIALTDDRDVSRSHVEIRLDGWRVLVIDLGSVNGTQLAWPNLAPQLLPPRTAQEIVPGCALILAPDVWIHFEEDL